MTSDARQQRGYELAKVKHQLFHRIAKDTWIVPSATCSHRAYVVDPSRSTCTCPDSQSGARCKHLWAVAYLQHEITLIDGTHLKPPPVKGPEESATLLGVHGGAS